MNEKEISSAEMTCTWRSDEPEISLDCISKLMVTPDGLKKTRDYQTANYPLASRHLSIRAGYFLKNICHFLETQHFDSIISIGSGLSLLTHCIINELNKKNISQDLIILDADLDYMIQKRIANLAKIHAHLPPLKNNNFFNMVLDVEETHKQSLKNGKNFSQLFPVKIKCPIFIFEGISYFLKYDCLKWIFESIKSYDNAAIVFDYWPINASVRSVFFKSVLEYFATSLPENVQCLLSPENLDHLSEGMTVMSDVSVQQAEIELVAENNRLLLDENVHVPMHMRVLYKYKKDKIHASKS